MAMMNMMFVSVVLVVLASFCAASDAPAPKLRGAIAEEEGSKIVKEDQIKSSSVSSGTSGSADEAASDNLFSPSVAGEAGVDGESTLQGFELMMPSPTACTCTLEKKCLCSSSGPLSRSNATLEVLQNRTEAITALWQSLKREGLRCDCVDGSAACGCHLESEMALQATQQSSQTSSVQTQAQTQAQEQISQWWASSQAPLLSLLEMPSVPARLRNTFWGGCGCSSVGCYCGHLGGVGGASAAR